MENPLDIMVLTFLIVSNPKKKKNTKLNKKKLDQLASKLSIVIKI